MDLQTYMDGFERQISCHKDWDRVLIIKNPTRTSNTNRKKFVSFNIFKDFKLIPLSRIKSTDFECTRSLKDASSMFEALQVGMTQAFKVQLRLHHSVIQNQGPHLLWFIMHQLTIQDDRVQADFHREIHTFEAAFKDTNYDANMCCTISYCCLLDFQATGGNIKQNYNLISNMLTLMHCDSLISLLREWEQHQMKHYDKKSVLDLVQKFPSFIKNLINNNNWPFSKLPDRSKLACHLPQKQKKPAASTSDSKSKSDISGFVGSINTLSESIEKFAANAASFHSQNTNNNNNKNGKGNGSGDRKNTGKCKQEQGNNPPVHRPQNAYTYCTNHWGPDKFFKNEQAFKKFYYEQDSCDKDTVYLVDGTRWAWCENCSYYFGNHSTKQHCNNNDDKKKAAPKQYLPPISGNAATISGDTLDMASDIPPIF